MTRRSHVRSWTIVILVLLMCAPVAVYAARMHLTSRSPAHPLAASRPVARAGHPAAAGARLAVRTYLQRPTPLPVAPIHLVVLHGAPPLSTARYDAVRNELFGLVARRDPRAALRRLSVLMRDPSVSRSCHALVHEIGHAAYRKYRDFAMAVRYQDDLCGSGFLHGVVEMRFASVADVGIDMQTICNAYLGTTMAGLCFHGVGHGVMNFTRNNLPLALQMCSSYASDFAKVRCSEGVFMENFNTDRKVHPSGYLNAANPIYPCPEQAEFYKGSCYFYAPIFYLSLHDRDFAGALRWCDTAEPLFRDTCVSGVGSRIMKQNIQDVHFVERTCVAAGVTKVRACIDGMVSYYLVNFNSLRKGRDLCAAMEPAHQTQCSLSVEKRSALYPE